MLIKVLIVTTLVAALFLGFAVAGIMSWLFP